MKLPSSNPSRLLFFIAAALIYPLSVGYLLPHSWNDLAEEMPKRAAEAERRISFETAHSGNGAGYLTRLFDFHEQLTDEWVGRLYGAHYEAWTQQRLRYPTTLDAP
jgi:hypothetical protein